MTDGEVVSGHRGPSSQSAIFSGTHAPSIRPASHTSEPHMRAGTFGGMTVPERYAHVERGSTPASTPDDTATAHRGPIRQQRTGKACFGLRPRRFVGGPPGIQAVFPRISGHVIQAK